MDRATIVRAVLTLMLDVLRPGQSVIAPETEADGITRYEQIAEAIVDVGMDEHEVPAFGGRRQTIAALLAVSWHESGWRRDVDLGVGPHARGDHGASCGLWQIHLGAGSACDEVTRDRRAGARAALHLIRQSWSACGHGPRSEWLAAYASGSCERGHPESASMMRLAERWNERLRVSFAREERWGWVDRFLRWIGNL